MKITSATLQDNTLTIKLDSSANVTKLYIDDIRNSNNFYSENDEDHTYVITDNLGSDVTFTVDVTDYNLDALMVTVISDTERQSKLAIDLKDLYYKEVNLLVNTCDTCQDKKNKEKILVCSFRNDLLKYALQNNLTDDAISHYVDLCRILRPTKKVRYCSSFSCGTCSACSICSGSCSTCKLC